MSNVTKVSADTDINSIIEILDRDGCVIIEGLLNSIDVTKLKAELQPHFNEIPDCNGDFYGHHTKRMSSLIAKSSVCREIAIKSLVLKIMDSFLLKTCSQYQLNLTQGISIGPGEPSQIIHRDDLMFPFPHTGSEWMINCMWAVDEFTVENGATNVVLGSHKWAPSVMPEKDQIIQASMKSGSLLIYMASLLHGGGANVSHSSRTGIVMSYSLGWLRQAENQYLAVPQSVASQLPERLQRLIGYTTHQPNLGCVEGQDPILLLQGRKVINGRFEEFISEEDKIYLKEHREGLREAV